MAVVKTLEEDLTALGLMQKTEVDEPTDDSVDDHEDADDADDDEDEDELDEVRISRKRKKRRRRPLKRLKAREKAKQRLSARKRRRSGAGKKMARIRGKALKRARKKGLKPGTISISTQGVDNEGDMTENVISSLLEDLESLTNTLTLTSEQNELRQAYEHIRDLADLIAERYTEFHEDLPKSLREEVEDILEGLDELKTLADAALKIVEDGNEEFKSAEGTGVSLNDVLEDLVEELNEYVDAIDSYSEEI